MKEYSRQKIVTVNFAEKILFGANGQFGSNLGQNYAVLNLISALNAFLKYFRMMGLAKWTSDGSQFFQKIPLLRQMSNYTRNFQIFAVFRIMIYFNNLFEMLSSMIGKNRQTKSYSRFSQKNSLWDKWVINFNKISPNLCNYISHLIFDNCEILSRIMRYDRQINVTFKLTKKSLFEENSQMRRKLVQNYTSLHLMM